MTRITIVFNSDRPKIIVAKENGDCKHAREKTNSIRIHKHLEMTISNKC